MGYMGRGSRGSTGVAGERSGPGNPGDSGPQTAAAAAPLSAGAPCSHSSQLCGKNITWILVNINFDHKIKYRPNGLFSTSGSYRIVSYRIVILKYIIV
jgi:hypothetical protein